MTFLICSTLLRTSKKEFNFNKLEFEQMFHLIEFDIGYQFLMGVPRDGHTSSKDTSTSFPGSLGNEVEDT
jgi:hypothetical protein